MDKYYQLYSSLEGFKRVGSSSSQYIALCPYHQDTKPSFSINTELGLHNCKACGKSGNAYQYAQDVGHHNPKEYISDMNGYQGNKYPKYTSNNVHSEVVTRQEVNKVDLATRMEQYKANLKSNWESMDCSKIWDKKLIDELDIGLKDNVLVFAHHNKDSEIINYKVHNKYQSKDGDSTSKWYLRHKIGSYTKDKDLFICEGEKDAICLYNAGKQVTSGTCGCNSIPNVDDIDGYIRYIICYDKDKAGIDGAKKLAKELLTKNPKASISIIQWNEDLLNAYDIFDAYMDDLDCDGIPKNFKEAIGKAEEVELDKVLKEQIQGFEVLNIEEFLDMDYEKTESVIQYMADKGQVALIGGDTGCKKSWIAIQSMLSVASGTPLFDDYTTTQMKTMLVQFENENYDIKERCKKMIPYFTKKVGNKDWLKNVNIIPMKVDSEIFIDNWTQIEKTIAYNNFRDGLLIVDNMYTSTDKNIQENNELKELLQVITSIRKKYNLTMILICHTNKHNADGQQKDLNGEQLQGGKTLLNNVANVTMLHQSTLSVDLGIMKVTKGGRSARNDLLNVPIKLKWDDDYCIFNRGGIADNLVLHFQTSKETYEVALVKDFAKMPEIEHSETFDRETFVRNLPKIYESANKNTITRLLTKLIKFGLIEKLYHNTYRIKKENLEEISDGLYQ